MARISREEILTLVMAGNAIFNLFRPKQRSYKKDILGYAADAILAYDQLRGVGDKIEQADQNKVVPKLSIEEVAALAAVIRAVRRAASVVKEAV
jgi:hypothetical protein